MSRIITRWSSRTLKTCQRTATVFHDAFISTWNLISRTLWKRSENPVKSINWTATEIQKNKRETNQRENGEMAYFIDDVWLTMKPNWMLIRVSTGWMNFHRLHFHWLWLATRPIKSSILTINSFWDVLLPLFFRVPLKIMASSLSYAKRCQNDNPFVHPIWICNSDYFLRLISCLPNRNLWFKLLF